MKNVAYIIIALVIVGCVAFFIGKQNNPIPGKEIVVKTEYLPKWDTVFIPELVYDTITRDTGTHTIVIRYDTIRIEVETDTPAVVKDYFTAKGYVFDTTVYNCQIIDSIDIYANRIIRFKQTFIDNEHVPNVNSLNFNAGLVLGYNELSPMFTIGKNKFTYGIGYNILESKGRFSLTYKIK
jgi:hypothetical protein